MSCDSVRVGKQVDITNLNSLCEATLHITLAEQIPLTPGGLVGYILRLIRICVRSVFLTGAAGPVYSFPFFS